MKNFQSKEKQMLQLSERINSLRELIGMIQILDFFLLLKLEPFFDRETVKDESEPAAREGQAEILLQDVENFQFEISELRNMGIEAESKRQADIQSLYDAAGGMVETMRDILATCQQATQESSDKKSEVAGFEASLTKAENAIESMPECSDTTQGARQLSQLEGIRHDIAQIQKECLDLLSTNPQSKNLEQTYVSATGIEKKRAAKSAEIETVIKKMDESADLLNQIELWCQRKENFDDFEENLEKRIEVLNETISEAESHEATLQKVQSEGLMERVLAIKERSEKEIEELESVISLTKSITTDLRSITASLDDYQKEFNSLIKNVATAASSNLRLEKLQVLQTRLQAVESPVAKIEQKIEETKSALPATQYDQIEQNAVDQRSRLVDLLVRVENRKAQLSDIIKEKTEIEIKLNNCQIRVIDIETELEMGLEANVELDRLRKQNDYTKELKEGVKIKVLWCNG